MGPARARHKEHSRLCMAWACFPAWECQKPASSTAGLILLCAQTCVWLTVVSGERAPLLVKKAARCSPAASLPACCLILLCRDGGQGGGYGCDRPAPVGSATGCLFPLFLPSVRRYLELFCLCADILQDCGNGNLRALTALVFTLQAVSNFPPANLMLALTAGRAAWAQMRGTWPPCLTQRHSKQQRFSHGQCFGVCRGGPWCRASHAGELLGC